ncbi:MAG: HEAT repeat domain-containing protein [Opitutaceae bacterium]|nr:HEAT repeat domain-containing protein [Opitutaceae bacterium]
MSGQNVDAWLSRILSKDAMTFEDAYWGERPPPEAAVPKILESLKTTFDPYTRGKLVELLGESGDKSVLPILEKEMRSPDQAIREWACASIAALRRDEPWQKDPKYL